MAFKIFMVTILSEPAPRVCPGETPCATDRSCSPS